MEEIFFKGILNKMAYGYALHKFTKNDQDIPNDYVFLEMNPAFEAITGLEASKVLGKRVSEVIPDIKKDHVDWIKTYSEVAFNGREIEFEQYSKVLGRKYHINAFSPSEGFFVTIIDEIQENWNLKEQLFEANQILKRQAIVIDVLLSDFKDSYELLDYTLHNALKLTQSQYGYIYLYDEVKEEFDLVSWTNGVISDCKIMDQKTNYRLSGTGLWGEAVRQKKPIVVNDYDKPSNLKKGCPSGHVKISKFVSIPIIINGKIVAVAGMANKKEDYSRFDINEMTILMQSVWQIMERKKTELNIKKERARYQHILNEIPIMICELDENARLTFVNTKYCEIYNMDEHCLEYLNYNGLLPHGGDEVLFQKYKKLTVSEPSAKYINKQTKEENISWYEWNDIGIFNDQKNPFKYYSIGYDITEKKMIEDQKASLLEKLNAMINGHQAVMLLIEPFTGQITEANKAAEAFYGYTRNELLSMNIDEINTMKKDEVQEFRLNANKKGQKYFTFPHRLKNGQIRIVDVYSSPIEYMDKRMLFSIIFDVSERERAFSEVKYLAYHDYLTGVYNRRYWENEFENHNQPCNFPLAIIMGDVNGLKLINDNFGHSVGDIMLKDISRIIQSCVAHKYTFARVGGDEFAILLGNAEEMKIRNLIIEIEEDIESFNKGKEDKHPLSVSFGYAIQREKTDSLDDLMREAETFMYRRKYYDCRSIKSKSIDIAMNSLFAKSEREKNHSERVGYICEEIARRMGLDTQQINKVRVAGLLHDIGKIGVKEDVLNKRGELNEHEWRLMKLHPQKGAKILKNTIEFSELADIILCHHERWDGKGYPGKLKGEETPLESRIIAVADAYDAMINERSYRKRISKENAIAEITKGSGSQFDPRVVQAFIKEVVSNQEILI